MEVTLFIWSNLVSSVIEQLYIPDLMDYHLINTLAKYVKPNLIFRKQSDKSRKWDIVTTSWPGLKTKTKTVNIMNHTEKRNMKIKKS